MKRLFLAAAVAGALMVHYTSAQNAPADTLFKLAIFTPSARVYDRPRGEVMGTIGRGRVIRLLSSQESWLEFTTYDFPRAWIRWEDTITLKEWASAPPFDSVQLAVLAWERGIRAIDREVEEILSRIVELKDRIAAGSLNANYGAAFLDSEHASIEDAFRRMHDLEIPQELQKAAEIFSEKRWAIDMGLKYLSEYFRNSDPANAVAAGKFFEFAENRVYWYSSEIFRVKSKYRLYENVNEKQPSTNGTDEE